MLFAPFRSASSQRFARKLLDVLKALYGVSILGWFLLLFLIMTGPSSPNVATDHIVPYQNHGAMSYVTPFQDFCLHCQLPLIVLVGLAYMYVEKRLKATAEIDKA